MKSGNPCAVTSCAIGLAMALGCSGDDAAADANAPADGPGSIDAAPVDAARPDAASPDAVVDAGTDQLIDNCTGVREFLPIPASADILFVAGIYAQDLFAPTEIYALDIDARNTYRVSCTNLAGEVCTYAGVHASPDRSQLVVMRGCADTNADGRINFQDDKHIAFIDLVGDNAFGLPGYLHVNTPDWSVNGDVIFAGSTAAGLDTDIYLKAASEEVVQNLTDTDDTFENDCAWSPDGTRIVFARGQFVAVDPPVGQTDWVAAWDDLYTMDSSGGDVHKVVSFGAEPCVFESEYSEHFCKGLVADPSYLPDGNTIVYAQLLSVAENDGRGRWNIMSAAADGLDQNIQNLTNHATAFQDIAHASARGVVFHEVDIAAPFYGLVLVALDGTGREVLVDNSTWSYYLGAASWLP